MVNRALSIMALLACTSVAAADVRIMLDPTVEHQTITGWEATAWIAEPSDPAFPYYKDTVYDLFVNEIGIDRVRLEIRSGVENENPNWSNYQTGIIDYPTWRSRRYATVNDNSDPCSINWAGFHFSEIDHQVDTIITPLRKLLEAKGEKLYVNLNYVAFTGQITGGGIYIHNNPEEYAEFVLATYLHLQSKYGWVPDSWEVLLEPDNVSQWDGRLIGRAIVAAADRLETNGFDPVFVAPSNTNMGNAVTYFDDLIQVPGALKYLREFSYHRYGGVSDTNLKAIASRAVQYNINTSMLEWWFGNATYHILHKDLTMGRNSAWQQETIRGFFNIDDSNPINPTVSIDNGTKFTRQYYRFVRRGAVRITATSDSASFDPVAFINANGRYVVVVKANAGGNFTIEGLPSGDYGIKYTTANEYDVDLPVQSISAGLYLSTNIPNAGVLTVYQRCGTADTTGSDLNADRFVGLMDLDVLAYYWLDCICSEPYWCDCADFDQSGAVAFDDFAQLAANWGAALEIPPGRAGNPNPPDGAIGVSINADLIWSPDAYVNSHDVYFGISNPPPFIRNQIATTFDPGVLAGITTYFWRIDEVNPSGTTTGTLWSFTTGAKGRYCFPADTPVWVDGALVQISKVTPGQKVGRFNCSSQAVCSQQIESIEEHEGMFPDCYDIVLESGKRVSVVGSHLFLVDSGQWIAAHNLRTGSILQSLGGPIIVKSIAKRQTPFVGTVYNLRVKSADQYFIGEHGIVVRDY
ncbi:MAG: hypothetical protein ACYS80_14940 [Planctomycetota bacterium]